jgi:hypothetical protein
MIGWLLDAVPWWVWALALALAAAGSYPMWIALWAALPAKARAGIPIAGGGVLAYLAGRNRGRAGEQERQAGRDARAETKRREIDDDVRKADPRDRDRDLDRWMRD